MVVRLLTVCRESDAMKGQLNVKTPAEYIAAVDDKRRSDIAALDALIRKHAPKLEPVIMGGMLGYGPFHYRYASGREGDACKLSIASNASYISLYCFAADARATSPSGTSTDSQGQHRQVLRAVQEARRPRREGARGAHQGDREDGPPPPELARGSPAPEEQMRHTAARAGHHVELEPVEQLLVARTRAVRRVRVDR